MYVVYDTKLKASTATIVVMHWHMKNTSDFWKAISNVLVKF